MTKAWPWLKKWGWALLAGLVAILTLGFVSLHVKKLLGRLRDEKQLAEAKAEIEKLEAVRTRVRAQRTEEDAAVVELNARITEQKRRAVEAFEGGEGLSDEQLEDAFREALGG